MILEPGQPDLLQFQAEHDFNRRVFELRVLAQRQRHIFANGHRAEQRAALK